MNIRSRHDKDLQEVRGLLESEGLPSEGLGRTPA